MAAELDTAMILAAGMGTRMRPLTDDRPKPLVELSGRKLLDRVLDRLSRAEFSRAVVNVHYRAELIEEALQERASPAIEISDERDLLLDTGGGVSRALPLIDRDSFLIHNSDSVWVEGVSDNLERLREFWDPERMDCLMLLALSGSSIGFEGSGDFLMSPCGRLRRRPEREQAPFVFTGVSIAHRRMFADPPDGAFSLNVLWDRAIERDRLFGIRLDGFWMHVGTPDALSESEHALRINL
ncbi:MAG: nucleotidyltransferase family protein [Pseudomonadota bacterium]